MKVLINKSDNKLIEMQSHATEGTLLQNALNAGFLANDIEEKEVTPQEYQVILDLQPKPQKQKSGLQNLLELLVSKNIITEQESKAL